MTLQEIIKRIIKQNSHVTKDEVIAKINEKMSAAEGFLTDEAAARLVAIDYGIEIEQNNQELSIQICDLISGLNNVTIIGIVIEKPREIIIHECKTQITRFKIADKTGVISVVVWNSTITIPIQVKPGQIVRGKQGYIRKSKRGKLELHIGKFGEIQIIHDKKSNAPLFKELLDEIIDLRSKQIVNIKGVIKNISPLSNFRRQDGSHGKVRHATLADNTGSVPTTFWNDRTDEITESIKNRNVLLLNVKVRKGRQSNSLELHVGDYSFVELLMD